MDDPRYRPIMVGAFGDDEPCASCGARSCSVCSAIDAGDLARLAAVAVPKTLASGQTLIEEGDATEHFFNITSGMVKLFKTLPDGRRQIIGFTSIGGFLGLAVSATYAFSAEAVDDIGFCRFSRTKLRGVMDDYPRLEQRLLATASNELVAAQEQMLLLGRKTAKERVASFLLGESVRGGCCFDAHEDLHLPMSRHDIADYLGLTIETVSRTFTRLKNDRLIDLPNPAVVKFLKRPELRRIAEGYG